MRTNPEVTSYLLQVVLPVLLQPSLHPLEVNFPLIIKLNNEFIYQIKSSIVNSKQKNTFTILVFDHFLDRV